MKTERFRLGAVLSMTTGKLLCQMEDIYKLAEHLAGEPVWTHQLPRVGREAKPHLLAQFLALAAVTGEEVTPENFAAWLYERVAEHGLLMRAAQANGHPYPWVMPNGFGERPWNPLENNEDALMLAVRIGLQVTAYPMYDEPKHSVIVRKPVWDHDAQEGDGVEVVEPYGTDALAATRRAITMCAAELARRKTPNVALTGPRDHAG